MLKWLFNRASTGVAQDIHRALLAQKRAIEEVQDGLRELRKAQTGFDERLAFLEGAHKALRGRFYATRGRGIEPEEPATREERRAQAFRNVGFVPGRPVNHAE